MPCSFDLWMPVSIFQDSNIARTKDQFICNIQLSQALCI